MPLTRRQLLGATAVLGLAGCAAPATAAAPGAGPIDSPEALADWIGANREPASVLVDDGRGGAFTHLADRPRPIASATKVVHLVAYAQAVAAGRLDPADTVPVAEWARWYVPGADGGAHPAALESLGATPDGAVTWDDLATVMIDFSDNAAADLFCETLGADALVAAAAAGGWPGHDVAHIAGEDLYVVDPSPAPDRRAAALELGRAYAAGDPPVDEAGWAALVEVWDGSWAATATQLANLHRAAATDGMGTEVSATVRRHLERGAAGRLPGGALGLGQKSGSLPGILSSAGTIRGTNGIVGVAVVSLSRLPAQVYGGTISSTAVLIGQQLLVDADLRDRLRAALAA